MAKIADLDLKSRSETGGEHPEHQRQPTTEVLSPACVECCPVPKGYCLIINNSADANHEQMHLQDLIRKKFKFIVTEWSHMNSHKLIEMLKFLKGQLHSDQCLLIVFLSNWKSNTDGKKSISFQGFQKVISKSAKSMEFTVLVVSDVHGLPQQGVPLATFAMDTAVSSITASTDHNLHQCIIKNGNADDVDHQFCQLREFLSIGDEQAMQVESVDHGEPNTAAVMGTAEIDESAKIQLQEHLEKFTSSTSDYAVESHEEVGGYGHPEEYVEYSMVFKFWESIRMTMIDNVHHQRNKIKELSSDLRKKKLACAFNSLITGILTFATVMFLLLDSRDRQYTGFQIILISFGVVLQLLSMAGNICTIYIFLKKHKAIKLERNIADELAEIDQRHWVIVDNARQHFENNENTREFSIVLTKISPNAINTLKNVFNLSTLTAYSARLVATTFLRTLSVGLRLTLVLAIAASALFVPVDIIEICYIMWLIVWKKESKNVTIFNRYAECLQKDLDDAHKEIEMSKKELRKAVERRRSQNALNCSPAHLKCQHKRDSELRDDSQTFSYACYPAITDDHDSKLCGPNYSIEHNESTDPLH